MNPGYTDTFENCCKSITDEANEVCAQIEKCT